VEGEEGVHNVGSGVIYKPLMKKESEEPGGRKDKV
jgi:hypothetical protein